MESAFPQIISQESNKVRVPLKLVYSDVDQTLTNGRTIPPDPINVALYANLGPASHLGCHQLTRSSQTPA